MRLRMAGAAVLFIGVPGISFGSTITSGSFDIAGTIFVTAAGASAVITPAGTCPVDEACIFWQSSVGSVDGGVDISSSGLPNGDIPASLAGNDAANILNLTNQPVGSSISVPDFMTFNDVGVTTGLTLTLIDSGIFSSTACTSSPAPGQTCTPAGSFLSLVNSADGSTASWVFEGTTTEGSTWTGDFTSEFNTSYQTVLGDLATNGYVSNPFLATITLAAATTTPEPGSLNFMMICAGLSGFAAFLRRLRAR